MFMHTKLAFLGFLSYFICLPAPASIGCPSVGMGIPIQVPPDISAVSLSNLRFAAWNSLDASFFIENRAAKEITYLTIVLEYRMKKGAYSLAVVYEAAPDTIQPSDYRIPAEYVQPLPRPILPGQKKRISGSSPYTPPECPGSVRLIMLDIHFGDNSSLRWESSGWWTAPLLSDYPEYLTIPDSRSWTSEQYFFLAMVNREGQLEQVVPIPSTSTLPSGTVTENLKKLSFFPYLGEGKPQVASIILILKFNRPGAEKGASKSISEVPTISKPAVFISLHPRDSQETDWDFDFGRGFGYKTTRIYREH